MEQVEAMLRLGQDENAAMGEMLESYVRGVARQTVVDVMLKGSKGCAAHAMHEALRAR